MAGNTLLNFATIGGFFIGIVALGLTISQFRRKPKLVVDIEKSSFVHRDEGIVDYQINVHLSSLNGDSYIKEILLISDEEIAYQKDTYGEFVTSKRGMDTYIKHTQFDLTTLSEDDFDKKVRSLYENGEDIQVKNLTIKKDLAIFCTFTGRLAGRYYSDHSRFDIKTTGWKLRIETGNEVKDIYLDEEFLKRYIENNT